MPWTGLWTGLKTFGILWFAELVTGCLGKKRAWGLAVGFEIAHDCTYAMICMHSTLRGGLVTMAVSGLIMYLVPWACQGLIHWGSYARVEA